MGGPRVEPIFLLVDPAIGEYLPMRCNVLKHKLVGTLLLSILVGVLLPVAAQETFTHEPTGLSFTLPAGWAYVHEGDHFEATSPDESVILLFLAGRSSEVEKALDEAVNELDRHISDVNITTEATQETINGLTQVYLEGDGMVDGEQIDWDLTLVIGGRSSLAIVALGDIDSSQGVVDRIYASVKQ